MIIFGMYKEDANDFRQTKDRQKVDTVPEKDVKSPFLASAVDCSISKKNIITTRCLEHQ